MQQQHQVSNFVFCLVSDNPEEELDQKVSNSSDFILAGQFKISLHC